MKCEKCKVNESTITMTGVGNFCMDCHNDHMSDLLGVDRYEDYSKRVTISDTDGIKHQFEISNLIMPGFSEWIANEQDGDYQFVIMVKPEDNQAAAVKALHEKILAGIEYKTLHKLSTIHSYENAIRIGDDQCGLNSIGSCRIQYSEDDVVCLVIDGKKVALQDFGRALSAFEGFTMDFQIRDITEDILGKDMALKQLDVSPDAILERFERTLGWFLDRGFLSDHLESACAEALFERIDDIELLFKCNRREDAVAIADKVKKRLLSIDHDTVDFPDYLIGLIDRAVGKG